MKTNNYDRFLAEGCAPSRLIAAPDEFVATQFLEAKKENPDLILRDYLSELFVPNILDEDYINLISEKVTELDG